MLTRGETSSVARQTNKAAAKHEVYTTLCGKQWQLVFLGWYTAAFECPYIQQQLLTHEYIHKPTQVAMSTGTCKHTVHLSQGQRRHSWYTHARVYLLHVYKTRTYAQTYITMCAAAMYLSKCVL